MDTFQWNAGFFTGLHGQNLNHRLRSEALVKYIFTIFSFRYSLAT